MLNKRRLRLRTIRAFLVRLGGLFHKGRRDRELAEEIESNLQLHIEDNLRAGMSPEDARRNALLKFGGIESAKEAYRDRRSLSLLEDTIQDIRYALRMLSRRPGLVEWCCGFDKQLPCPAGDEGRSDSGIKGPIARSHERKLG